MSTALASPTSRLVTLPAGVPDLTLGWEVVRWAAKYLRQPNGPNAGERFRFVDSQIQFLLWWYAVDPSGDWLYYRAVRRLAKGSGKSPFAALLALAEFTAPVRLKDFDPKVPGGCVGKPVTMPLVQIAATAESQTENTMRMVRAFAPRNSRLVKDFRLDPGKTQYFKSPEGTLQVITSSSAAAEGAEATAMIGDETEHWLPRNGGVDFEETLADNLAKSGSRMVETCNSWKPGAGSIAEGSFQAWVAQEEGRTKNKAKILYDARKAPPDSKLDDEESLDRALAHVYGDCWWADRAAIKTRIWHPKARADASKRKYFNWPTTPDDAWIKPEQAEQLIDTTKVVEHGEQVALFFDGSKSRDATGLLGCRLSDGHVFVVDAWEPDPNDDEDEVPVSAVDAAVHRAFRTWDVRAFFGDVREWESFVKVDWPGEFGEQLDIWAVPGGKSPEPIAWDMRTRTWDFTQACELTYEEIVSTAKTGVPTFTIDGNPVLLRHLANARTNPNRYGVSIGKESHDSPLKIDLAVCLIGARMVRKLWHSSPHRNKKKQRTGRVW
jgi:hypothetical protein